MTLADLCLIGAVVIAMVSIGIAKGAALGQFDNANPRDPDFYKDPFRARARGAHQNSLEAFPIFAAAVLVAEMHGARQMMVDALAVVFLVVRVAYVAAYLKDKATVRSILWGLGMAITLAIFCAPVWARR
jgi:uncharacterized MAPEG superfamily protein